MAKAKQTQEQRRLRRQWTDAARRFARDLPPYEDDDALFELHAFVLTSIDSLIAAAAPSVPPREIRALVRRARAAKLVLLGEVEPTVDGQARLRLMKSALTHVLDVKRKLPDAQAETIRGIFFTFVSTVLGPIDFKMLIVDRAIAAESTPGRERHLARRELAKMMGCGVTGDLDSFRTRYARIKV